MKTFTNYAEKKAKQFLNLLQGYTKGIRITAILLLLLMGVSNAWAWWFVPGTWNNWDASEASSNGIAQMNGSNTITLYNIAAGSYEMKLVKGSTWGNGNYTNKSTSYITSVTKGNNSNDKIVIKKACDLTFTITNEDSWNCDVSASDPTHYIKYNWNGSGWAWSGALTASNNYSCTGQYGGSASFDHTRKSSTDESGTNATGTTVNSPTQGDKCVFTYNTSTKALTITRCNKVTANSKIYFDNSLTNWSNSNIYFVVGHDKPTAYSKVYKMNAVNNTKLFYAEISETWEDATYYAIVGVDNEWSNGNWGSSNLTSATKYTAAYTDKYDLGTNGCYYITPSTGNNNTAFTITYKEGYNNIPKITATQSAKIRNSITDQQYTTATGTWPATLKLEGTYLTGFGNDKSARSTISSTTSGSNVNYEAVVTGKITHSYTSLSNDYQFDGWGTSTPTAEETYEYHITANTTVYAFFTKKYAVNFGVHSSGGGTISAESGSTTLQTGNKIVGGSEIIFTASPSTGYRIQGWYSDANCTNSLNNGINPIYTINPLTTNATVYVKYEEIPEEKFAVTIQPNNANYGTVSPSGSQQVGESGIDITATAKTGYQFDKWTCTGGASVEDASNPNTIASATAEGTVTANFSIKNYTITYNLNGGTNNTSNPASYTVETETITLQDPTKEGFLFAGWYTTSTFSGTAVTSITKGSTDNKTLYAKWVPYSQCIFFKNTLSWSDVYIYTFTNNAYWDNGTGVHPSTNKLEQGKMTQLDKTDIYYYILTDLTGFCHIAFSDYDMRGYELFNDHKAIYRSDRSDQMPLFIPQKDQTPTGDTHTTNKYYSSGIWMKYNSTESGYKWSSDRNGWSTDVNPFTASAKGGYTFTTTVILSGSTTYLFKVNNIKGDWYSKESTMTQDDCTDWWFQPESDPNKNAVIQPNVTGDYVFTVYLGDGKVELSLEYPLSVGDYRLSYYDAVTGLHPGHYIKKRNEDRLDTVSFFIHVDNKPQIRLERCTEIDPETSTATWEVVDTYNALKTSGADPTSAQLPDKRKSDAVLYTGEGCGIETSGVYNFILKQSGNDAELATDLTHAYVGDFYIRTDAADGGWDSFRQKSNQITYSSFADKHSNFNHYYCKYIKANQNVKFTIANDYSYCISDTLDNDEIIEEGQSSKGCLPINANVRFGWDSNTNEISRAYIKGAGMTSDRFLVLQGNEYLKDANGNPIPVGTGDRTGLLANEEILVDQENWIYQVDVTANKSTLIKLIADYNGTTQYFKGSDKEYTGLLSSTASKDYKIRLVYDFKSNHLVTAWLAGGNTVENTQVLGADMMVIRKDQNTADQLNFNPLASPLNEVGTGYAVMTFTKDHILDNDLSERERSLYWVSFPFDVKVSDVFGFGEYAEHWILQYYDGAERAEKGLFSDSGTYWKYIFDTDTELKAGEGYVLVLDLNKIEFLHGAEEVSLYFPSIKPLTTISGELPTKDTVPEHWCNIDREWTDPENGTTYHHKWTDSHWNLIGVPGFADIQDFNVTAYHFTQYTPDVSFYYAFDLENSTYIVASAATNFQAMYSYMVQFAGTINWVSKTVTSVPQPEELAARRNSNSDGPERVALRLELAQGEEVADRTFVQLQQEGATANFDLSLDLTKIMNSGFSNIYTLTDSLKIQVAGNALPMEETVVPVGVNIAAAGEYTFRMPDGTEGMVVELIDYEANTTTNLLLDDYTVNLPAGSNETRFALSLKPEKTATSIESTTTPSDSNIRKFIIDGKLYLQKDGMLYDAQGHIVR